MTAIPDDTTAMPGPIPTIDWLQERLENAERIARQKYGADRAGWLEDAAYFRDAIKRLRDASTDRALPMAAQEIDRLFFVIESAVRNADPMHYDAVLAALKANRDSLFKDDGTDQPTNAMAADITVAQALFDKLTELGVINAEVRDPLRECREVVRSLRLTSGMRMDREEM